MTFRNRLPILAPLLLWVLVLPVGTTWTTEIPWAWDGISRIVAVGDLHGDYDHFVAILQALGLVDTHLDWSGGTTHLVQTGDIMDRGPDARRVFDLIRKLEAQAPRAGGRVHMLIANHEEMNVAGIAFDYPGYVTVEQFLSFLPEDYRARRERAFRQRVLRRSSALGLAWKPQPDELYAFWQEVLRTDAAARRVYVRFFNEHYGPWLLRHNAVIRINDVLFVHGGISPRFADWSVARMNRQLRRELQRVREAVLEGVPIAEPFQIAYKPDGPLWYRGLAREDEATFGPEVDRILKKLGVRYMVVGHTRLGPEIQSRFGGRVWLIDTGISRVYGGHLSALIIEGGRFRTWKGPLEERR